VKLSVFIPTRSRSTLLHNRRAASRATFLRMRWSSIPFKALDSSSFVNVLPPTTFRNSPPMAPKLEPTIPVGLLSAFLSLAASRIAFISSPMSLSMNLPSVVLVPQDAWSISCTGPPVDTSAEGGLLSPGLEKSSWMSSPSSTTPSAPHLLIFFPPLTGLDLRLGDSSPDEAANLLAAVTAAAAAFLPRREPRPPGKFLAVKRWLAGEAGLEESVAGASV
jgi:hypothetical protein